MRLVGILLLILLLPSLIRQSTRHPPPPLVGILLLILLLPSFHEGCHDGSATCCRTHEPRGKLSRRSELSSTWPSYHCFPLLTVPCRYMSVLTSIYCLLELNMTSMRRRGEPSSTLPTSPTPARSRATSLRCLFPFAFFLRGAPDLARNE
jgi:hypothetical protein